MIDSLAKGSPGNGKERYGIYLPFHFPESNPLELNDESKSFEINSVVITIKRKNFGFYLYGGEFTSENEAKSFLENVKSSLSWYSLKHKTGIEFPEGISNVKIYNDPLTLDKDNEIQQILRDYGYTELHGEYDAESAHILPIHLSLSRGELGKPRTIGGRNIQALEELVIDAFSKSDLDKLKDNEKIKLGIRLYCSSQHKQSSEAEFLALFNSIEVLLEETKVSETSRAAIYKAIDAIEVFKDSKEPKFGQELDSLCDTIRNVEKESIIKRLINQIAKKGAHLIDDVKVLIDQVYSTRNTLVHEGSVSKDKLQKGLIFLRKFVPLYLEQEFNRITDSSREFSG